MFVCFSTLDTLLPNNVLFFCFCTWLLLSILSVFNFFFLIICLLLCYTFLFLFFCFCTSCQLFQPFSFSFFFLIYWVPYLRFYAFSVFFFRFCNINTESIGNLNVEVLSQIKTRKYHFSHFTVSLKFFLYCMVFVVK